MNFKGVTKVSHDDLTKAVVNWRIAEALWEKASECARLYREKEYQKLPWSVRMKNKFKFYNQDYHVLFAQHRRDNIPDNVWNKREYLDRYLYLGYRTALECEEHSSYNGEHYLTPDQVEFVSKFKRLKIEETK